MNNETAQTAGNHTALEPKHSGLGIASFVMSLGTGFMMLVAFGVAAYFETKSPGGMSEESPEAVLVGLMVIGTGALVLLALGLGVAGLCQRNRRKVFAAIGVAISGMTLLATVGLMIAGLVAGR